MSRDLRPCRGASSRGFTVIELLVVISLIALLIAILLPSLASARDRARYTRWRAYSKSLETDTTMLMYWNFEEQEIGDEKARNRANYDPNYAARVAYEPEELNLKVPENIEWTQKDGRWKGAGGLIFDGSDPDDRAETTRSPASQQIKRKLTVFAWIDTKNVPGEQASIIQYPWIDTHDTAPHHEWALVFERSSNSIYTKWNGTDVLGSATGMVKDTGDWNMVAIVADQETQSGYFFADGKKKDITTPPTTPITYENACKIYLGRNEDGNTKYHGVLDEIGVFDRALSFEETKQMYRVGRPRNRE